jgi:hypothetical protein
VRVWGTLGLLLGAWVGALARLWMRLIVVYPEAFSWSGTLAIIISAAIGGLGLGLVRGARLTGRSKIWRLAALPFIAYAVGDPDHHNLYDGAHYLSISVGLWTLAVLLAVGGRELFMPWSAGKP